MAETYSIESILVADCGAATTRAIFIDVVDDQYRFVARGEAPTSIGDPHHDITVGVIQAIRQLESLIGRRLLDDQNKLIHPERTDHTGVDAFVATVSAAEPLRAVLAGLSPALSASVALRAASQTHTVVEGTLFLASDHRPEEQVELLRSIRPDAVILVGGTDGGAVESIGALADLIGLGSKLLEREARPELVFAGNVDARPLLAEKAAALINVHPVDNIEPMVGFEQTGPLVEELERLHAERKLSRLPGFGQLSAWSPVAVSTSTHSFGNVIRFLSEQFSLNVLGVHLGSNQTALASMVDRHFTLSVGARWGVGGSAERVLQDASPEKVARWVLVEDVTETEIVDAVLTKAAYPRTIAVSALEREAEQAVAREALRMTAEQAMSEWPQGGSRPYPKLPPLWDLIVLAGGFLPHQPTLGQGVLAFLDAVQPIGVCTLAVDAADILPALGALAAMQPLAAAQALEHDGLLNVGTLICPVGIGQEGDVVMRAKLTYPDREGLELEVTYGSIEVIPLPLGQKATLQMRPTRQFDIGWGHKGRGAEADVDGGLLGLVIDARGRPLRIPMEEDERVRALQKWRWHIGY